VITVVLILELAAFWARSVLVDKAGGAYPENVVVERVREAGPGARVLGTTSSWPLNAYPRAAFPPNAAMAYGIDDVQGYDSLFPGRYKDAVAAFLGGVDPSPPTCGNMVLVPARAGPNAAMERFFAVTHVLRAGGGERRTVTSGDTSVFFAEGAPRAYITESVRMVEDERAALEALPGLWAASREPPTLVIGAARAQSGREGYGEAEWSRPQPNLVLVSARAEGDALLVVRDTYCPGWRAYVDGEESVVLRADFLFRGVAVAKGEHRVWLAYEPMGFKFGLFLTLLGVAAIAGTLACRGGRSGAQG